MALLTSTAKRFMLRKDHCSLKIAPFQLSDLLAKLFVTKNKMSFYPVCYLHFVPVNNLDPVCFVIVCVITGITFLVYFLEVFMFHMFHIINIHKYEFLT